MDDVERCVAKRSLNNWYEARLIPAKPNEKGRKVYCYLTPRVRACSSTTGLQSVLLGFDMQDFVEVTLNVF